MNDLVEAVRRAVADSNPYAALALSLALPDVCASLEASNGKTSGTLYAAWWDKYVRPAYVMRIPFSSNDHVFMEGGDCYALRCAFLHQGMDDITAHKARVALEKFRFVQPATATLSIHRAQNGAVLLLQVSKFCEEMCAGVEGWWNSVHGRTDVQQRVANLMRIEDLNTGISL